MIKPSEEWTSGHVSAVRPSDVAVSCPSQLNAAGRVVVSGEEQALVLLTPCVN